MAKDKDEMADAVLAIRKRVKKISKLKAKAASKYDEVRKAQRNIEDTIKKTLKSYEDLENYSDKVVVRAKKILKTLDKFESEDWRYKDTVKEHDIGPLVKDARWFKKRAKDGHEKFLEFAEAARGHLDKLKGPLGDIETAEERLGKIAKRLFRRSKEAEEE